MHKLFSKTQATAFSCRLVMTFRSPTLCLSLPQAKQQHNPADSISSQHKQQLAGQFERIQMDLLLVPCARP